MGLFDTLMGQPKQPLQTGSNLFAPSNNSTLQPAGSSIQSQPAGSTSSPLSTQYDLYNQGVKQQAGDYDSIMQGYKDLAAKASSLPAPGSYTSQQMTPAQATYKQSGDLTGAISNLQQLSNTGGYSGQDIADLRARGVSPIRSVYSSAQSNIDRAKSLQGGYSPNYTAATAKLTRDESQQIADATQNVNAGIAQNVAANKLQVAPQLASVTAGQSDLANNIGGQNTDRVNNAVASNIANSNNASQFNIQSALQNPALNAQLEALNGQRSLYGTTPALASLFGTQALQGANLQAGINNSGNQLNSAITGQIIPRLG